MTTRNKQNSPAPVPNASLGGELKPPVSRRTFLLGFVGLLAVLGGIFVWMMWVLTPKFAHLRQQNLFYECLEVVSGDTLLMQGVENREDDRAPPFQVKVVGITAPPMEPGPGAAAFAAAHGLPESEVPGYGIVSRKALSVWLFKQSNIKLYYDQENPVRDSQGRVLARVELAQTDVGKIHLREGQCVVSDEPHAFADRYQAYQDQARAKRMGLWRHLP